MLKKSKRFKSSNKLENCLTEIEKQEFEQLSKIFARKFDIIDIENNNLVYGYKDQKKETLGSKKEYYRYKELKSKTSKHSKLKEEYFLEKYNNFNIQD